MEGIVYRQVIDKLLEIFRQFTCTVTVNIYIYIYAAIYIVSTLLFIF